MSEADQSVFKRHVTHTANIFAGLIKKLQVNPFGIEPPPNEDEHMLFYQYNTINDIIEMLSVDKRSFEIVDILLATRRIVWGIPEEFQQTAYWYEDPLNTKRTTIDTISKMKLYIEKILVKLIKNVPMFNNYVETRQIAMTPNIENVSLMRDMNEILFLIDNITLALRRIPDYDAHQFIQLPFQSSDLAFKILGEAMDNCSEWKGDAAAGITETLKATAMIMLDAGGAYGTPESRRLQKTISNVLSVRSAWFHVYLYSFINGIGGFKFRTYTNNHVYREMVRSMKKCISQAKEWLEPLYNDAESLNEKNIVLQFLDETERSLKLRLDVSKF